MKTMNKYLFLLAAVVFSLTACEKQQEREPSPAGNSKAVAFEQSAYTVEINPSKAALEFEIKLGRPNVDSALTVNLSAEGDVDIINVPKTVSFAAGTGEVILKLTFPNAEVDSTYSVTLAVDSVNLSPYISGNPTCTFTVVIAAWEPAAAPAIFVDGIVCSPFGLAPIAWYVDYQEKTNSDGSKDYRFFNPYREDDGDEEADNFGVYSWFVYNSDEDVDMENTYNWDIHVDAQGNATFGETYLGPDYGYGPAEIIMAADFFAKRNGTDPDYETYGIGVFDETEKAIIFPAGTYLWYFEGYGGNYASLPQIIYLDSKAYQNDHLSIADYNDPTIEWEEQESVVNQFESTIFNFTNEEQKLYKAVDQYPGNEKSPFIDLYSLKDAYAAGGNLAFYWSGKDNDSLDIPVPQNTKLSFMGKDLYIQEAEGAVVTSEVKGTSVKVFTFNISVASKAGDYVGDFTETFTVAEDAIIFEKSDFIGNFSLDGFDPFYGDPASLPIEIQEVGEELAIIGIDETDTIWADFDAETGILSIAPQELVDSFTYRGANYARAFVTMDDKFDENYEEPLTFAFKLNGTAVLTANCKMIGYLIFIPELGGALDGLFDVSLTPAAAPATGAPAKAPAALHSKRDIQKHEVRTNKPSVSGLSFQGKRIKAAKDL